MAALHSSERSASARAGPVLGGILAGFILCCHVTFYGGLHMIMSPTPSHWLSSAAGCDCRAQAKVHRDFSPALLLSAPSTGLQTQRQVLLRGSICKYKHLGTTFFSAFMLSLCSLRIDPAVSLIGVSGHVSHRPRRPLAYHHASLGPHEHSLLHRIP